MRYQRTAVDCVTFVYIATCQVWTVTSCCCVGVCGPYLGEDSVDGDLLLEEAACEVHLGSDVTAVDLDLADVRLLLPQLHKPHLKHIKVQQKIDTKNLGRLHHVVWNHQ